MYSVIIVDDEEITKTAISGYLHKNHPEFQVVGMFSNGAAALDYLHAENTPLPVHLVITDIRMPRMDGLELAGSIHREYPAVEIMIISGYDEFEYARQAIKYGVSSYLLKPLDFFELSENLEEVKSKFIVLTPQEEENHPIPEADDNIVIQKAMDYIRSHYGEDLSREDVANAVYLSPAYFSRFFKQKTGVSFIDYLTSVRMEKAAELLKTHMKVLDIARSVGYQSKNRFFVNFRQYSGYTPTEYRRQILHMETSHEE